jgi:UDP-N-acetyl-D-glucosamine dehydrogenase
MFESSPRLTADLTAEKGSAGAVSDRSDAQPSGRAFERLLRRIRERTAHVGVIGLGYVGLPLARAFTTKGFRVLGLDLDPARVARLRQGKSPLGHLPDEAVREMTAAGFEATDRMERLDEPDAILLCVPTPLTAAREPDLGCVVDAARAVAGRLRSGQLVVLESTTYPGTTRDVVLPILAESGLRVGEDFFLAYSPEREDPGNPHFSTATIPRVVGGLESHSLELAATLYEQAVARVVRVSSPEVAEACKILENTYRAVNIALVNELKVLYERMGIDVWEVIEAAKTKPFGFQAFYPGPGLGGHCIPIDPFYLAWVARKHGLSTRFIELAGEVNTAMPQYVVGRIADALNDVGKAVKGSRVLLLGMAYKKDVDDTRESPGLELLELLLRKGADVQYNDPHVPRLPATHRPLPELVSQELTAESVRSRDCVVIVTDHSAYDWAWLVEHAPLVVDTRNATRGVSGAAGRVVRA